MKTDAEKIAKYDRIVEIIDAQVALEDHMQVTGSWWTEHMHSRAIAYRAIGEQVKGIPFPRRP